MFACSGVTLLTNTTYKSDLIIVTWDPASSPYCGEVLYYQVVISSDGYVNITNNVVNTTSLTATFLDLRSSKLYTITVTAVNKAGSGRTVSVSVNTATRSQSKLHTEHCSYTSIKMLNVTRFVTRGSIALSLTTHNLTCEQGTCLKFGLIISLTYH